MFEITDTFKQELKDWKFIGKHKRYSNIVFIEDTWLYVSNIDILKRLIMYSQDPNIFAFTVKPTHNTVFFVHFYPESNKVKNIEFLLLGRKFERVYAVTFKKIPEEIKHVINNNALVIGGNFIRKNIKTNKKNINIVIYRDKQNRNKPKGITIDDLDKLVPSNDTSKTLPFVKTKDIIFITRGVDIT